MHIKINPKILMAILIPMLLIPPLSYGYAHWTDKVRKQIRIHVGCFQANIFSYKVYSEIDNKFIEVYPPDEITTPGIPFIEFRTNKAYVGCYFWIGLILSNQAPFPVILYEPDIEIDTFSNTIDYINREFFYGPYKTSFESVWGDIKGSNYLEKLDPVIGVIGVDQMFIPTILENPPNPHKVCLWIYFEIIDGPTNEFSLKIKIIPISDPIYPII